MLMCELHWEQPRISFFTLFKFTLNTVNHKMVDRYKCHL